MDQTPRILIFCHSHYGPFADVVRQYAVLFRNTPYKVTSVYLTGEPSERVQSLSASDEVIFLNFQSREVAGIKLSAIIRLREIVSQRNFKLCIAHRFKPIYIALLGTRLPVIGVHHAFGDYDRWSHRLLVNRFRGRLSLLGISNAITQDLRKNLKDWAPDQLMTFYNHLDVDQVVSQVRSKEQARAELGLPINAYIVGNVGRLHPDKNQKTLIKGFARAQSHLPNDALLVILGSGRLEQELKRLALDLGVADKVRFLGQVSNAKALFSAFDLFALPSDHEPFGMVLLEAMAAKVPVIATDCGGAPEIVKDSQALFPLGDMQALAQLLITYSKKSSADLRAETETAFADLQNCFSDQVATQAFFRLPPVQKILGSGAVS